MYSADKIGAAPFLTIFAIWGFFYCVIYPGIALTQALGRTDKSFMWSIIRITLTSIAVLTGSFISIEAVAWAQVVITLLFFFLYWRLVIYPIVHIKLKNYLKAILKPCLFAFVAALPVLYFAFATQQIYMAIIAVVIYGLTYLSANYLGDKGFFEEMLSFVFPKKKMTE
jgi:O-antigen/teichoic acid export membrane protein